MPPSTDPARSASAAAICLAWRHRPAALAGHRLGGSHVDRVHIRALLAVHLDRYEILVHQRGRRAVLE
jgi:hypothetical protein